MGSSDSERGQVPQDTQETEAHSESPDLEPADEPSGAFATSALAHEPLDLWSEVTPSGEVVPAADEPPRVDADDGPFAVSVDSRPPADERFTEALRAGFRSSGLGAAAVESRAGFDSGPPDTFAGPTTFRSGRPGVLTVKRKVPRSKPPNPEGQVPRSSIRHYPKMWALLDDPEAARAAASALRPPPVPGTFFPAATRPPGPPQVADLDEMLFAMAEGLLVGETADGHAEVRITLRDEFFAGTELRLTCTDAGLMAVLAPPDRATYWLLSGNQHELEARLTGRGLSLSGIEVREP